MLDNKVILITGATSGIGRAVARRCSTEGARVMVHGLDHEMTRVVSEDLGGASGFVGADLTDPESPARIVEAVIERFGRIDGLVNNAADLARSNLETLTQETFDRQIAINLQAPLFLIQAALPHFREQGGGAVVNIGSVNTYCGEPDLLAYSISKGGMATMTRNLADAHAAEGIRINQLNPSWTFTENEDRLRQGEGFAPGWQYRLPKDVAPSGRIFDPDEIAAHVAFWLSDAAGPVSGSVFEVAQFPFIGRNPSKESS